MLYDVLLEIIPEQFKTALELVSVALDALRCDVLHPLVVILTGLVRIYRTSDAIWFQLSHSSKCSAISCQFTTAISSTLSMSGVPSGNMS